MSKVYTGASMSIDGYISGPDASGFEHLFKWYSSGDIEVPTGDPKMTLRMTQASVDRWNRVLEETGSLVVGRRLYDYTNGWGGRHPMDLPVVVLTHEPPTEHTDSFVFVTEGIEAAIAKARELAGDKVVGLNSGTIASQALDAGLIDEIWVDLAPVILGEGTPFFSGLATKPVALEGPLEVIEGKDVTHLRYRVAK